MSNDLCSVGRDKTIYLWNITEQDDRYHWIKQDVYWNANCLAIDTSNRFAAIGDSNDNSVRIIDLKTRVCNKKFTGHLNYISGIAYHPQNENLLVTACHDARLIIWTIREGVALKQIRIENYRLRYQVKIRALCFSDDGLYLAFGDQNGTLWQVDSISDAQNLQHFYQTHKSYLDSRKNTTRAIIWENNTKQFISANNRGEIIRLNPVSCKADYYQIQDELSIYSLLSLNEHEVLLGCAYKTVILYDFQKKTEQKIFCLIPDKASTKLRHPFIKLAIKKTPNGHDFLIAHADNGDMTVFNLTERNTVFSEQNSTDINFITYSNDLKYAFSINYAGGINCWRSRIEDADFPCPHKWLLEWTTRPLLVKSLNMNSVDNS